jgi:hypothetical protein
MNAFYTKGQVSDKNILDQGSNMLPLKRKLGYMDGRGE